MALQAARENSAHTAVSTLYNALMTGFVLTLVKCRGADVAASFVKAHFRKQHLENFLSGLKKLDLSHLPHAVACAQYHYLSNALGGVKTEYIYESDRKAWVRYPPPRWIWQGAAICGIPPEVNEAMLHGWHAHNGISLGNPRLGFVCTGQTVRGDPGLEGYYFEYDFDLCPEDRLRFVDEKAPIFIRDAAPVLDTALWPAARRQKVSCSYATTYVRTLLVTAVELFGAQEAEKLVGDAARLIGMQFYDQIALSLGIVDDSAEAFALCLQLMCEAQGEYVARVTSESTTLRQIGWKLMRNVEIDDAAFRAWNQLWEGALSVHNRTLRLHSTIKVDVIEWHVV